MALNEIINIAGLAALEEAEILAEGRRRIYNFFDPFEDLSNTQFIKLYRLSKPIVLNLIDLLDPYMQASTSTRVGSLTSARKVITALRFFASGSYQTDIGRNMNHALSQSSVSNAIKEISDGLSRPEIINQHIRMPHTLDELKTVRNSFYQNHNFPGVIGCIDCTHVAIYPSHIQDPVIPEAIYVNRKGYHSINVQLICDTNLKINNIKCKIP